MGKSLQEIAQVLKDSDKKVQLIYAFNGTGKTRLSREFAELVNTSDLNKRLAKATSPEEISQALMATIRKIIYYNAFTEDLFYWNNMVDGNDSTLRIQPNDFTDWILIEQGVEDYIVNTFRQYVDKSITPVFSEKFDEIQFAFKRTDGESSNVKISKGEESCFIWSVFYTLVKEVISILNEPDETNRTTSDFNELDYIFIDDPVTSLDENHLIKLAVDLAQTIRDSKSELKFIITTHNPLFYNVLYNELKSKNSFLLGKIAADDYTLDSKLGDSNKSFSYHHHLIDIIQQGIDEHKIEKYHFVLLRNLYEKTANFLGYKNWSDLLPEDKEVYASRVMNFYSHRTLAYDEIAEPTEPEKQIVTYLFRHLIDNSKFWKEEV